MRPRCYIAGKITDLPEEEYKRLFDEGCAQVTGLGFDPVSPVLLPHKHGGTWGEYMREGLTEMLSCDSVFALSNWQRSRGASIEVHTALAVKMKVIYQADLEPF